MTTGEWSYLVSYSWDPLSKILAKNMVKAIWLANGKIVSDVRLNAMLLDVWEANANQDIYILIRLIYRNTLRIYIVSQYEIRIAIYRYFSFF